jgi:cytochrome c-type biogenesis protein CcmF
MLKIWNVSLVLATGILAILGTFLVRSGILQSIHAFGASTLGVPFLVFIGLLIALAAGMVIWRAKDLKSDAGLDSMLSREAIFLLNNLVLVSMCVVVFWFTFWPLISDALGDKRSVGPPTFNSWIGPLAIILVLLTGLGPALAWRRATAANLRRQLLLPGIMAAITAVTLAITEDGGFKTTALFTVAAFSATVVIQEYVRGVRARRLMASEAIPVALVSLVRRNRRRYGGYLVHLGVITLFVGVAASSAFQKADDVQLRAGQSTTVGGYDFTYVKPTGNIVVSGNGQDERIEFGAILEVRKDGKLVDTLRTTRGYYPSQDPTLGAVSRFFDGESTSEVGLDAGPFKDVWTVVSPSLEGLQPVIDQGDQLLGRPSMSVDDRNQALVRILPVLVGSYLRNAPPADFRLEVSPMVTWIWIGALIVFLGGLTAAWPNPRTQGRMVSAGYAARLARELNRV